MAIVTILQKVRSALQHGMTQERYERLDLSYEIFPKNAEEQSKSRGEISRFPFIPGKDGEKWSRMLKRSVDIAGSCAALLLLSPVLPVIAALVKISSKGPVLFCQKRIGQHGREFMFYKFRTMYVNNDPRIHEDYIAKLISGEIEDKSNGTLFKIVNDPRVTRFGSFLRRTSLDELPQFFNVLLDDMSLVGPRPPLPYEFGRYQAWHRRRVLELKPGLTGLWQVQGRSTTTFDEMVRMDLRYARSRSFWVDLHILCQTPGAMLSGRGAC
ncbi:sugar transferase [Granulicella arctica]|uniref:sugar transferase n=1 Tax=Granulicella arctica TaxID=940613 RepID=UPI0021E01E72|nr:sugar transferase [Granulicella arctica]